MEVLSKFYVFDDIVDVLRVKSLSTSKLNAGAFMQDTQSTPTPPPSFSQLDDSLKPLQPLASSSQSMLIYYEHVALAERYVKLQQERVSAQARVAELKRSLQEQRAIRRRNEQLMREYQRLADENEDYIQMKESLERQLGEVGLPVC
ncbi:MAP3K7 [Bugula neritina]|uniref:MAP3K7 n=1 Tax=Bugula neritina TaxID=10212 RepID=A0A7J7IW88_BUGNE|nr:MAP3K7 [Bugula neritina]